MRRSRRTLAFLGILESGRSMISASKLQRRHNTRLQPTAPAAIKRRRG